MNDILNKEPMEEDYGIEKSLRPQFFLINILVKIKSKNN